MVATRGAEHPGPASTAVMWGPRSTKPYGDRRRPPRWRRQGSSRTLAHGHRRPCPQGCGRSLLLSRCAGSLRVWRLSAQLMVRRPCPCRSWQTGRLMVFTPLRVPQGSCVGGQKGGGGEEEEAGGAGGTQLSEGSVAGASHASAGQDHRHPPAEEGQEEEEEEEADASDLLPLPSWPRSTSTTAVVFPWLVTLVTMHFKLCSFVQDKDHGRYGPERPYPVRSSSTQALAFARLVLLVFYTSHCVPPVVFRP